MGRVVSGANWLWGKLSWGELYMGRVVRGASFEGRVVQEPSFRLTYYKYTAPILITNIQLERSPFSFSILLLPPFSIPQNRTAQNLTNCSTKVTCGEQGLVATTMFSTPSRAPGDSGSGVLAPLLASVLNEKTRLRTRSVKTKVSTALRLSY